MVSNVIFAANFESAENIDAFDLELLPNVKVTIAANTILQVANTLKVAKTANLTLLENAQLLHKSNPESPNAFISVVQKTGYIFKFDYTYFCSPVADQKLNLITDGSVSGGVDSYYNNINGPLETYLPPRPDQYYSFNDAAAPAGTDGLIFNTGAWQNENQANFMNPAGKGFIVRGPDSFPASYNVARPQDIPQKWQVKFTGQENTGTINKSVSGIAYTPFNGAITVPVAISGSVYKPCNNTKFTLNLIGNPYPAVLDADSFLSYPSNTTVLGGYLAFWSHKTAPSASFPGNGTFQINYSIDDFVFYNLIGGIGNRRYLNDPVFAPNDSNRPTGKIATCQGFFTRAVSNGSVTYTEDMKDLSISTNNQQFYRTNSTATIYPTKNRFWISLQQGTATEFGGNYRETLIGYMPQMSVPAMANTPAYTIAGSLNTYDKMYDSEMNTTAYNTSSQLNSRLEIYTILSPTSPCPRLMIQGRKLDATFNTSDVVPIGFSCPSGTYTIRVEKLDGLFQTQQLFWLRQTQGANVTYHDIRNNSFTFFSGGDADNSTRFAIVFKLPLIGIVSVPLTCGTKLQSMSHTIYCQVPTGGAPSYRFEVRSGAAFGDVGSIPLGEISVPYNQFSLGTFNSTFPGAITYNTTYYIRVTTIQIDDIWQFGNTCIVTSAAPPTAGITAPTSTHAGCGSVLNRYSEQLFCNSPTELGFTTNGYRFEVSTDPAFAFGTVVGNIERNSNSFSLAMLNTASNTLGLYQPIPNQDYFIRLQIRYSFPTANTWQVNNFGNPIYGAICSVRTGNNPTARATENDFTIFEVKAFPNPFASAFNLEINTSSDEKVTVKTYDMIGRLIDTQEILATEISAQEIGNQFPAGVYNIVVTQGENVKTLRVIKR